MIDQKNLPQKIKDYKDSKMDEATVNELFQWLVDTGEVWEMASHYSKTALELAKAGRITLPNFGLDTTYFYGP